MEYEFIHDSFTGLATARFSMEHEIMGPWLDVEVGNSVDKLNALLNVVANVKERKQKDITMSGIEYTLIFSEDSVQIISNADFEHMNSERVELEDGLNTGHDNSAECGIEDFHEFLIKWISFIT